MLEPLDWLGRVRALPELAPSWPAAEAAKRVLGVQP